MCQIWRILFTYHCLGLDGGENVSTLLRRYIQEADIRRFYGEAIGPDGVPQRVITGHLSDDLYIIAWLSATRLIESGGRARQGAEFVDWTRAEAESLFRKIKGWWNEEGRQLLATSVHPYAEAMILEPIRSHIDRILDALESIIIPRTRPGTRRATDIVRCVREIGEHIPVERVLPALLRLEPSAIEATASQLRQGAVARDKRVQLSSLRGMITWAKYQEGSPLAPHGYSLPPLPNDLLQELGYWIASRRQPGLNLTMEVAIWILRNARTRGCGVRSQPRIGA